MDIFAEFIFSIILLIVNLILVYKPIPILAFPVQLFSMFICATVFLPSNDLPMQPFYTLFLIIIVIFAMIVNALDFKQKKGSG